MTLTMLSTVSAQNSNFLLPNDPEADFGSHGGVENTGAAVCETNGFTLSVMVWGGDKPGFGWDLDYGAQTGFQSLASSGVHDPDIVVCHADPGILAHIVYKLDDYIFYEIWQYNISSNDWSLFTQPTQLSDYSGGLNPNIDRISESVAVVWSNNDKEIRGVTGNMMGNYSNVETIYYDPGNYCIEPDVALTMNVNTNPLCHISVVFKIVDGDDTKLRVVNYDYDNFSYNSYVSVDLDGSLMSQYSEENDPDIEFGTPRIAAYDNYKHELYDNWTYQVVMVEKNYAQSEYIVHGFNRWAGNILYTNLNGDDYYSQLDGSIYNPKEYPTKEPVVSYLEDVNVAWAYQAPETGNWEIVYRLLENSTGYVRETNINNYPYSYSLVNGIDNKGWKEASQHHPCIASRFSVDEKVIGWFDDDLDMSMPEYKVRQTNTMIFGVEEDGDPDMIYPNPATKWLNIQLPDGVDNARLEVYSINGKCMISEEITGNLNTIDISGINSGMYIAEIKLKNKTIQKKFIKQ